MHRVILLTALVACQIACSEEEEEEELTPPTPFLQVADLEPDSITDLSEFQLVRGMDENPSFYDATSADFDLLQEDGCQDAIDSLPVKADKVNLTIDGTVDLAACGVAGSDDTFEGSIRILIWLGCEGGDMAGFDGRNFGDLAEVDEPCQTDKTQFGIFNVATDFHLDGEVQLDDETTITYGLDLESASVHQAVDGQGCRVDIGDAYHFSDACVAVDREIISSESDGESSHESNYVRLDYRSLVAALEDTTYFLEGGFDVVLNNWTGAIRYRGANQPPTYEMSDGTTEVSGTLGDSFGSTTSNTAAQKLHRRVKSMLRF